ncbi:hypothetical protein FPOAC1_003467 [Fusarium poae]|uniref:hypothetical protein n=1 Tax=Fusarium poae TaxID=36050 RepID=UPI001CEB94D1|nr:hypothetical protein FPOAC1_003467 [Fusarium poae]KAG8677449.1 hypothetical protein FPOAC1_003467 [Fusarium poae]
MVRAIDAAGNTSHDELRSVQRRALLPCLLAGDWKQLVSVSMEKEYLGGLITTSSGEVIYTDVHTFCEHAQLFERYGNFALTDYYLGMLAMPEAWLMPGLDHIHIAQHEVLNASISDFYYKLTKWFKRTEAKRSADDGLVVAMRFTFVSFMKWTAFQVAKQVQDCKHRFMCFQERLLSDHSSYSTALPLRVVFREYPNKSEPRGDWRLLLLIRNTNKDEAQQDLENPSVAYGTRRFPLVVPSFTVESVIWATNSWALELGSISCS